MPFKIIEAEHFEQIRINKKKFLKSFDQIGWIEFVKRNNAFVVFVFKGRESAVNRALDGSIYPS
jgi:hypothetical protein